MKNLMTKEFKEFANSLKGLGKPAILLLGFLGFAHYLSGMDDTSTAEAEGVDNTTEDNVSE